ncbi:uncharacterized protein METZ01_LOCUS158120, partial [marine metagenome]
MNAFSAALMFSSGEFNDATKKPERTVKRSNHCRTMEGPAVETCHGRNSANTESHQRNVVQLA